MVNRMNAANVSFAKYMVRLLVMTTALLVPTVAASAQWTQWGGPAGEFRSDGQGLASTWPESGPKQVWKRELGEGYSAVLVEGDRLYTMYRSGDEKETVIALAAASGQTIWEHKSDSKPHAEHVMQFGGGPRATPAIDGDRLYAVGVSGTMYCLDKKDGKLVWTKELWKDFGGNVLNHGYSSSPLIYQDLVIVFVGGAGHAVVALNKSDGSPVWQKHDYENSFSSPKLISLDGSDQLIALMQKALVALNPRTGELLWEFKPEAEFNYHATQAIWGPDNILFVPSFSAGAHGLKLVKNGDKVEVQPLWNSMKVRFEHVAGVGGKDYVYGCSGGGHGPAFMTATDIRTGKLLWRERGFTMANCIGAGDYLIILDEDGQLALAKPTPEKLNVLSKTNVLEKVTWTVPTLVGTKLYVRDKKHIMALDLGA